MSGGAGNDAYFVDNAGDAVIENAGEGNDAVFASINYQADGQRREPGPAGRRRPAGLRQWSGQLALRQYRQQLLDGGAGADAMSGGAGNDTYFVDNIGDRGDRERRRGQRHGLRLRQLQADGERGQSGPARRRRPAGLRQQPGERALRQHRQQSPRRRRRRRRHERRRRQRRLFRRQRRRPGDREPRPGQRRGLRHRRLQADGQRGELWSCRAAPTCRASATAWPTRSSAIPATTSSTAAPAPTS